MLRKSYWPAPPKGQTELRFPSREDSRTEPTRDSYAYEIALRFLIAIAALSAPPAKAYPLTSYLWPGMPSAALSFLTSVGRIQTSLCSERPCPMA